MTTENTELDFEWMKRGGIVHAEGYELMKYQNKMFSDGTLFLCQFVKRHSLNSIRQEKLRMATRAECKAAGIEYIERPMSAEELESLREDKELLDFMIKTPALWVEETEDGFEANAAFNNGAYRTFGEGKTPREAIQDAMKGGV